MTIKFNYYYWIVLGGILYIILSSDVLASHAKQILSQKGTSFLSNDLKVPKKLKEGERIIIEFGENKENGVHEVGSFSNTALSNNSIDIGFRLANIAATNPYEVTYNYLLKNSSDGSFELDMQSVMNPLDMRFNDNVRLSYEGDALKFPATAATNTKLRDASGKFFLKQQDGNTFLSYEISVTNRVLSLSSLPNIEANTFLHTYAVLCKSIDIAANILATTKSSVKEWLSPDLGMLQQEKDFHIALNVPNQDDKTEANIKQQNSFSIKSIKFNDK